MAAKSGNLLLKGLEPEIVARVLAESRVVQLAKGDVVQHPGAPLTHVLFPETVVLAVGAGTADGESVDVALIGAEGVFGAFEACGSRQSFSRVAVHLPGSALRLPAASYRAIYDASPALRTAMHKHVEILLVESRQFVACNALHNVEDRLARALLDTWDRRREPVLVVTQDALAEILGVQRTTIVSAASALQRNGLIRAGRGFIELVDLPGLERAACSCRQALALARHDIEAATDDVCDA